MPMTVAEARAKAEEMKAKAAAKRAAREAASAGAPPPVDPDQDKFLLGEHNLILIDWDDTLFPTSAWKDRIQEGSAHPPRASKIKELSEAISAFVTALQQHGDVKIVTHGTKGWFGQSSKVLLPATKALLDGLDHRYRDSHGGKYMRKRPAGEKYTTDIGVQVDSYGEWFKTDMFFHFISEKKRARKWDETHLPEQVTLPRQVLIIGDGQAEKRSYDEHGNQARTYASLPGHAAVASVGLKGVFLKDGPSYDELVLQMRWTTGQIASTLLPPNDFRTMMWDLTSFPEWTSSLKAGANAYQPLERGSLLDGAAASALRARAASPALDVAAEEERQLQLAIAASMAAGGGGGGGGGGGSQPAADVAAQDDDEDERALQEALALSLSR